jgi:hypothetical protein
MTKRNILCILGFILFFNCMPSQADQGSSLDVFYPKNDTNYIYKHRLGVEYSSFESGGTTKLQLYIAPLDISSIKYNTLAINNYTLLAVEGNKIVNDSINRQYISGEFIFREHLQVFYYDSTNLVYTMDVKVIDIRNNHFLHRNNEWIKVGLGFGIGEIIDRSYNYYLTGSFNITGNTIRINNDLNSFSRNDFAGISPSFDINGGFTSAIFSVRAFNRFKPIIWSETLWLLNSEIKAEINLSKLFKPSSNPAKEEFFSLLASYEYFQTFYKDQSADFQQFSAGISYSF